MRLLIIGKMNGQIGAASKIAMERGGDVLLAEDISAGLEIARKGADIIMIDAKEDVSSLIASLDSEHINIPVIACGVVNDTKAAVAAIKAGAKEYIPLPPDADLIGEILTSLSNQQHNLIFADEKMHAVVKTAEQIAPSEASILVTGETGTGKEVFARFIHNNSKRKDKRFVAVNCAAIPENLLESELFGHEKGAFTGAVARRLGKFEEADGGTLLLDEITEMDISIQSKLLRAIQEKEIDRIGGKKPVKIDTRIIATSNRNMQEAVDEGIFREDLYYRLNVINLRIPALRKRKGDIKPLAEFFIKKYTELNDLPYEKELSDDALKKLENYAWRGNVRELENTMHRAVLMSVGDKITAASIILEYNDDDDEETIAEGGSKNDSADVNLVGRTVEDVEKELIIDTLKHCLGNRTHAANILGISIRTLRNKIKKYSEEGAQVP